MRPCQTHDTGDAWQPARLSERLLAAETPFNGLKGSAGSFSHRCFHLSAPLSFLFGLTLALIYEVKINKRS